MSQENPDREAALTQIAEATGVDAPGEQAALATPANSDQPDEPDSLTKPAGVSPDVTPPISVGTLTEGTYTIKAKSNGKYLSREGQHYVCNRGSADQWEKFKLENAGGGYWYISDYQGEQVVREPTFQALMPQKRPTLPTLESGGIALREKFLHESAGVVWTIEHVSGDVFAFKAAGAYITVEPSGLVAANRTERKDWETFTVTKV